MVCFEWDDVELLNEMATEVSKLLDKLNEDMAANRTLTMELNLLFHNKEAATLTMLFIYGMLDPVAKGRLERIAEAYKDGTI